MNDFNPDPMGDDEWGGSNYAPCCKEGFVSVECDQTAEVVTVPAVEQP